MKADSCTVWMRKRGKPPYSVWGAIQGRGPSCGTGYPRAGTLSFPTGINPTTAAGTAKHMTAVVFHPKQPT